MTAVGWTLVEPCCGSAALTLHLLGARRALVPYQGSKWGLRREIEAAVRRLGFFGTPELVLLGDAAPWAQAMALVLRQREAVVDALYPLVDEGGRDPSGLYHRLAHTPVPEDPAARAAVLLWLQRMNYASKAVGARDGRWVVHGLNTTSAFGVAGTDRFGEVRPQGAALLRAVEEAPRFDQALSVVGELPPALLHGSNCVYIDPPYVGTTPYPSGDLTREQLVDLARRWAALPATSVIVSEAGPIAELVAEGWEPIRLREGERDGRRQVFRRGSSAEEWITVRRAARP